MMTREDKLKAQSYCMFMIAGSYFADCICKTNNNEIKSRLQYQEMTTEKQLLGEQQSITLMEKEILPHIPDFLQKEVMQASFFYNEAFSQSEVRLQNKYLVIRFYLYYRKGRLVTDYEILYHHKNIRRLLK